MQKYRYGKAGNRALQFTTETSLAQVPAVVWPMMRRFAVETPDRPAISEIAAVSPVDAAIKSVIERETGAAFSDLDDAFVIAAEGDRVTVYANRLNGTLNGLMTFLHLLDEDGCFGYDYIYDYPFSTFRGIKLMMPGRDEIGHFKEFIDTMVFFRHNTVMLEIGGAMEYKRHPEINEGWEEYAKFMSEYSGKAKKIQEHTYPWRKNSIHMNNGGASFLTQEEVKDLADYCAARGITVIPEVPATSHCDYLLTRHPELAERPEDPYPDAFCPSNPDSYHLLFDVLDEVIEVFHPEVINVGHDEYYSINICDRCRKRLMTNYEILAEDLTKIHDYLALKGVKTMIWCDKLMNVLSEDGQNHGGAMNRVYEGWSVNKELWAIIRPTWQARDMIPKDIICMNWYWSYGEQYDSEVADFPVVFGNFNGADMINYRRRCGDHVTGGMCSNWGATRPSYLQRNRIYTGLAYNDVLFWNADYDDCDEKQFEECVDGCFKRLYDYHYGAPKNRAGRYIEITHTTDRFAWYHHFVDGVFTEGEEYEKSYYLGDYSVRYTDGTSFRKRIYLGEQVGYSDAQWYGKTVEGGADDAAPGIRSVRLEQKVAEVAYSTWPLRIDGKIFYRYLLENPYPEKTVADIQFILPEDATWTVTMK